MASQKSARAAFLSNKIITREYSDFEGAVLYRSYRTPNLELPPSAIEVEPITNLYLMENFDESSTTTPGVLSDCVINISNTKERPWNTFSLTELRIESLRNVEFFSSHEKTVDALELKFHFVAHMTHVSFKGICEDITIGNLFSTPACNVEEVSFQGLELGGEIRLEKCFLKNVDFSGIRRLNPDHGKCIKLHSCSIWECEFGDFLVEGDVGFIHCVIFNKEVFLKIQTYTKQNPMYFGEGAHSEFECISPEHIRFMPREPVILNLKNAHFESQNTLLALPETMISHSDFTSSVLGASSQNQSIGFSFMPAETEYGWQITKDTEEFVKSLRSQKISFFQYTDFSNSKMLSVIIYIVNPQADDPTSPKFMEDLAIFAHCNFSNSLLGAVKVSPEFSSPRLRFYDEPNVLKASLRKELFEGATIPIRFKNCNFEGCVSYVQDIREHGGIFFGKDSHTENVDLEDRELLAYFGENSVYKNVNFSNCKFLTVGAYSIRGCIFVDCKFLKSNAPLSIFQHCTFENCDFRDIEIPGAMFQSCEFVDCVVPEGYTFEAAGNTLVMHRETP